MAKEWERKGLVFRPGESLIEVSLVDNLHLDRVDDQARTVSVWPEHGVVNVGIVVQLKLPDLELCIDDGEAIEDANGQLVRFLKRRPVVLIEREKDLLLVYLSRDCGGRGVDEYIACVPITNQPARLALLGPPIQTAVRLLEMI